MVMLLLGSMIVTVGNLSLNPGGPGLRVNAVEFGGLN